MKATRKRIEQVIKELDYYPNETARTFLQKIKTIGLLLPDMSNRSFYDCGEMQEHKEN